MSERSPLPLAVTAKDHPGERTQILNVRLIRRINLYSVESDEDSNPERFSDTEHSINCNGDLDNPHDTDNDWAVVYHSDIEQVNSIENEKCPEQRDVCAGPNVPALIRPTPKSKTHTEKVFVTVNAIEMRRNKGVKNKQDRKCECFTSVFM